MDKENRQKISDEEYQKLAQTHFVELGWNDPEKKDYLVIVSSKPFKEVMAANAKGTTIYELIDLYGGVDGVQKAFPGTSAMYGDASNMPEMFSPDQLEHMAQKMSEYAKVLRENQTPSEGESQKEDNKGENTENSSVTPEQEVK